MPPMTRMLLIRTSSMGDLVHTLPALTDLAARFPALKIDWKIPEEEVLLSEKDKRHPLLENAVLFDYGRKLY